MPYPESILRQRTEDMRSHHGQQLVLPAMQQLSQIEAFAIHNKLKYLCQDLHDFIQSDPHSPEWMNAALTEFKPYLQSLFHIGHGVVKNKSTGVNIIDLSDLRAEFDDVERRMQLIGNTDNPIAQDEKRILINKIQHLQKDFAEYQSAAGAGEDDFLLKDQQKLQNFLSMVNKLKISTLPMPGVIPPHVPDKNNHRASAPKAIIATPLQMMLDKLQDELKLLTQADKSISAEQKQLLRQKADVLHNAFFSPKKDEKLSKSQLQRQEPQRQQMANLISQIANIPISTEDVILKNAMNEIEEIKAQLKWMQDNNNRTTPQQKSLLIERARNLQLAITEHQVNLNLSPAQLIKQQAIVSDLLSRINAVSPRDKIAAGCIISGIEANSAPLTSSPDKNGLTPLQQAMQVLDKTGEGKESLYHWNATEDNTAIKEIHNTTFLADLTTDEEFKQHIRNLDRMLLAYAVGRPDNQIQEPIRIFGDDPMSRSILIELCERHQFSYYCEQKTETLIDKTLLELVARQTNIETAQHPIFITHERNPLYQVAKRAIDLPPPQPITPLQSEPQTAEDAPPTSAQLPESAPTLPVNLDPPELPKTLHINELLIASIPKPLLNADWVNRCQILNEALKQFAQQLDTHPYTKEEIEMQLEGQLAAYKIAVTELATTAAELVQQEDASTRVEDSVYQEDMDELTQSFNLCDTKLDWLREEIEENRHDESVTDAATATGAAPIPAPIERGYPSIPTIEEAVPESEYVELELVAAANELVPEIKEHDKLSVQVAADASEQALLRRQELGAEGLKQYNLDRGYGFLPAHVDDEKVEKVKIATEELPVIDIEANKENSANAPNKTEASNIHNQLKEKAAEVRMKFGKKTNLEDNPEKGKSPTKS